MPYEFNLITLFSSLTALFTFILFIAVIFYSSIKKKVDKLIDRTFYKDKYNYRRQWNNISERLLAKVDIDELIEEIKAIITEILGVERSGVALLGAEADNKPLPADNFIDWLFKLGEPVSVKEFGIKQPYMAENNKLFLERLDAHVIVCLNIKDKILGVLAAGKKQNGEDYRPEDTEALKTIARTASMVIFNAQESGALLKSKEMAQFRKLSSALIHYFKNCLSTLSEVAGNGRDKFDNPQLRKDSLAALSDTIDRINNMMSKLTPLPEILELNLTEHNINSLIEDTIDRLKVEEKKSIKLFRFMDYVTRVKIDSEYMRKVITSLITNAIEAMPEGGNLIVRTGMKEGIQSSNGTYVQIEVRDSGCGMDSEFIRQHLFEAFQSSKSEGLGIGLFQCKVIVEAHGGLIKVESEAGKGTNFIVKLPVSGKRGTKDEGRPLTVFAKTKDERK